VNAEQRSVTVGMLLVFAGLAVRHHWVSRLGGWAGKAPAVKTSEPLVPIGSINDWQAAIVLYAILMLLGETQAAAVGPPIAWAMGLVLIIAGTGTLAQEYPALFAGDAAPPAAQQQGGQTGGNA